MGHRRGRCCVADDQVRHFHHDGDDQRVVGFRGLALGVAGVGPGDQVPLPRRNVPAVDVCLGIDRVARPGGQRRQVPDPAVGHIEILIVRKLIAREVDIVIPVGRGRLVADVLNRPAQAEVVVRRDHRRGDELGNDHVRRNKGDRDGKVVVPALRLAQPEDVGPDNQVVVPGSRRV